MYLCLDTKNGDSRNGPLVYTYIDGRKTDCMTKNELLTFCNRKKGPPDSLVDPKVEAAIRFVDSCKAARPAERDFEDANLKSKDFKGQDLRGANLRGADLESADLRGADLRDADLRDANLRVAYLKGADLRGADVTGAKLYGAYLNKADLRGVRGIDMEHVRAIRTLYEAKLDDGFREEIEFCCPDKLKEASWYWHNNEWADWRAKKGEIPVSAPPPPSVDLQ